MELLFWPFAIIVSLLIAFLFRYLKTKSQNRKTSIAAKYAPGIVGLGWLFWTLGGSVLFVGYTLSGGLFNFQLTLIIVVFFLLYFFLKNRETNDDILQDVKNENSDLRRALQDAQELNNQNLNEAIKEAKKAEENYEEIIYPIAGLEPHRDALYYSIETAKKHVLILSGWATSYVIDDAFISKTVACLKRGADVYLGFGYQNSRQKEKPEHERLGKAKLLKLQNQCVKLGLDDKLFIFELPNHAKVLIKDSDYFVCGSFNWLSNKSGKNYERSWVIKIPALVEQEFADVVEVMQRKKLEERRQFLKRFVDWDDSD